MCEPNHSIVQYPTDDQGTSDTGRLKSVMWRFGKTILDWFHFSKIGSGHTESMEWAIVSQHLILPRETRYEGAWWDRTFKIDGSYYGEPLFKQQAIACAEEYNDHKVMGSMQKFRLFLEGSLLRSDRPQGYFDRFATNVLTVVASNDLYCRLKRLFHVSQVHSIFRKENIETITKIIMGYTRKRAHFQSHWSDDNKLWSPG